MYYFVDFCFCNLFIHLFLLQPLLETFTVEKPIFWFFWNSAQISGHEWLWMERPIFRRHPWPRWVELTEAKSMISGIKLKQNRDKNNSNTKMKKTKWIIAQLMQLTNQSNMLSDSHLENPENPFCWKSFFNPSFPAPLSLSSRSSVLLSRFFSLQRILPTATRFPLFHPAPSSSFLDLQKNPLLQLKISPSLPRQAPLLKLLFLSSSSAFF